MKTFSERLAHALDVRGVSQHALARSTGLAQGAISNMVHGKRDERVGFAMVMKIARSLRIDAAWLGEGSGLPPEKEASSPDLLPQRGLATRLWREAMREERAVERLLADPLPASAADLPTLSWIEQLQYAERLPSTMAPPSPPARSHARPRADTTPLTRRSSIEKK